MADISDKLRASVEAAVKTAMADVVYTSVRTLTVDEMMAELRRPETPPLNVSVADGKVHGMVALGSLWAQTIQPVTWLQRVLHELLRTMYLRAPVRGDITVRALVPTTPSEGGGWLTLMATGDAVEPVQ